MKPSYAFLCCALVACVSGPTVDEEPRPEVDVPDVFPTAPPPEDRAPRDVEAWWRSLGDPRLDALIRESLAGNVDLRGAAARLSAALALARVDGALGLPQIDVQDGLRHGSGDGESSRNVVELGLVAAWEVDLFGRLDDLRRASVREARAAAEDLAALRLALTAEVARAWLIAVEQRQQLRLLEQQVEVDETVLELTELRFAQGAAAAVDVLQVRSQLTANRARVPVALTELRAAENRLDVLCGRAPDGLDRTAPEADEPTPFPALPAVPETSVPAELLVLRPDLRALRERLVAADRRAAAAFFARLPRLELTGSAFLAEGLGSTEEPTSPAFGAAATLVQPLIDQGSFEAAEDAARAQEREVAADFAAAFLEAVAEVEDLLYAEQRLREEVALLEQRAETLTANVSEARLRYANGATDYLPVLTAVADLRATQRDALRRRRDLVLSRVLLLRALGGTVPPVEDAVETVRRDAGPAPADGGAGCS